jgi:hypothetical protein
VHFRPGIQSEPTLSGNNQVAIRRSHIDMALHGTLAVFGVGNGKLNLSTEHGREHSGAIGRHVKDHQDDCREPSRKFSADDGKRFQAAQRAADNDYITKNFH